MWVGLEGREGHEGTRREGEGEKHGRDVGIDKGGREGGILQLLSIVFVMVM